MPTSPHFTFCSLSSFIMCRVTLNVFHLRLAIWSGTAQQQKPVDSGLLTTTAWHTKLEGDLTVVEDRQNCFQCTPKEALSKTNFDFGDYFFFLTCLLPVGCK